MPHCCQPGSNRGDSRAQHWNFNELSVRARVVLTNDKTGYSRVSLCVGGNGSTMKTLWGYTSGWRGWNKTVVLLTLYSSKANSSVDARQKTWRGIQRGGHQRCMVCVRMSSAILYSSGTCYTTGETRPKTCRDRTGEHYMVAGRCWQYERVKLRVYFWYLLT